MELLIHQRRHLRVIARPIQGQNVVVGISPPAGSEVPTIGSLLPVFLAATPAPACNPPDPNHGPWRRALGRRRIRVTRSTFPVEHKCGGPLRHPRPIPLSPPASHPLFQPAPQPSPDSRLRCGCHRSVLDHHRFHWWPIQEALKSVRVFVSSRIRPEISSGDGRQDQIVDTTHQVL